MKNATIALCALLAGAATADELRITTFEKPWTDASAEVAEAFDGQATLEIDSHRTDQTVIGFGPCMSELSFQALGELSEDDRKAVLDELYSPQGGAFTVLRTPIGANDFAGDFYSYAERPGDFRLESFSIARDEKAILPLIREAQKRVPADTLRIWASPWCPPKWMKTNGHYACRPAPVNDLAQSGRIFEGEDGFICDEAHFSAYADYFGKYIDAYREAGVPIWMVMPQNEFNSDQNFPSCTWSAGALAKFVGKYLGPVVQSRAVELYLGTMERPNAALLEPVLGRRQYSKYITGAGFQWAGRGALAEVRKNHPNLTFVMSEQECGDGKNDWAHAMHCWDLMLHYFNNGVSVYQYWNLALKKNGLSRWGWRQNSLVVVDEQTKSAAFTIEYQLLKHLSHFVHRGARRIVLGGKAGEALAFVNPDLSVAVMTVNRRGPAREFSISVDGVRRKFTLPPGSIATFLHTPKAR